MVRFDFYTDKQRVKGGDKFEMPGLGEVEILGRDDFDRILYCRTKQWRPCKFPLTQALVHRINVYNFGVAALALLNEELEFE